MAITAAVRQDIMELAVLMNNSAPGTTLLAELVAKSNAGSSLTEIAEHLAGRAEFTAKYPTFQTANEFATEWLANALPEASADLLAECVTIVEAHINGGGSIPALVVSVQAFMTDAANATGALKVHVDNFTNKVTVATYHTITKEAAAEWDIPASVTSNATTVTTAKGAVDTATAPAAAAAETKSLTIATDIYTGGSGDDVINATRAGAAGTTNTYNANDQIDGGEGTDSIYIESAVAVNMSTQKSLETVQINAVGAPVAVTLATDKAYKTLESTSSTGNVTFNSIRNGDIDAGITSQANGSTVTLNYHGTALTGASDNLDVTLSGADGDLDITGVNAANSLETLTINSISDGTLDDIDLTNANTTKLVVTGSGASNIAGITGAATTLNTIDASAATGAVTVTGVNTTANTITGGSGNDTLAGAAGNDTISSGTGDDQVTGAAGNDNVTLGAGNDTVVLATASDVTKDDAIDGGEGTDTLTLTGTLDYSTAGAGTDDASGIKGFEVLESGGTVTQDMTGLAANNTITSVNVGGHTVTLTKDTAITSATFTADNASLTMASAGTQTLTLGGDNGAGVPTDVSASTFKSGATALNLVSAGTDAANDNAVTLTGTALATLTVTGAEDVDVTANLSKAVATADFSGSTAEEVSFSASISEAALTYKTGTATQTSALTTGKGADTITLGELDDTVSNSGDGADTITAGGGNDTISATGKGADKIDLGAGDDTVTGSGAGNDTITGGDGNDTVSDAGADNDNITLGAGNDVVTTAGAGDDTVDGGAGNDTISGGAGADSLVGGADDDTINDGSGNDTVTGGDGNDTINITTGNDNVDAGAGNDTITITGLSGADTIDGGAGTDSITITNSSTGTLTPAFTNIESAVVETSSAFTLSLTTATDKTSLKTYTVTSTSAGADNIQLTDIASGSTVTISDDNSWDGASTADVDDTGDIGTIGLDTTAGGSVTLNVGANEDAVTHVATVTGATTIADAASVTINSNNADSNKVNNDLTSLALDDAETQTLVVAANANAGIDIGDITNGAALESLTVTSASNTDSTVGTMITATGLKTLSYTVNGGTGSNSSTISTGIFGGTTAAQLTTINAQVNGVGSSMNLESIDSASTTAATSVTLAANSANSTLNLLTGQATNLIDLGTGTLAALNITVAENATLTVDAAGAAGTITSGAITAATISLGNFSTLTDAGSNSADDITITGAPTTATVSLGRGITNAATDEINFSGATGTLALSTTLNNEAIALDSGNILSYGGNTLIDFAGIGVASYQHTGTGALSWVGSAPTGNQTIKSTATSSTADTLTGGAGNDTLTGNEGTNTISGGAANDTLSGLGGADSLSGAAGNDSLTAGEGADTVTAGLGTDTVNITESTAAADVIQITAGAVGTFTDNESEDVAGTAASTPDDRGEDTITGFDAGLDTIAVTATNVADFVHTTDLLVSAPNATTAGTATTVDAFVANTLFIALDGDAVVNDDDDIVLTFSDFKLNGVSQIGSADLLAATDIDQSISYNLTAAAGATTITTGDLGDTITTAGGVDTINTGTGADTITVAAGGGLDVITVGAADSAADNIILMTAAGTGATHAVTIIGFEEGAGTDTIDIGAITVNNGSLGNAGGVGATNTLAAVAPVTVGNNGQATANGGIFLFSGAGDQMAANSTVANAVAGAVTALTSTTDFSGANVAGGDDLILVLDDGTNSFVFQYLAAGTAGISEAGDMQLIAKVDGVADAGTFAVGDFI